MSLISIQNYIQKKGVIAPDPGRGKHYVSL